ncbi:DUF402 domain-containing protein [Deinococcus sp. QL22]|uniref:DUF402 domain-containing protein n=1 Tax=Deinococcus sp. QL22 TaxID=2939437 RepID=UPI002017FA40|nr:DUF402 domain-containing protein [Deinococcus sp. QL22]UQN06526.1 DUF402 domain-containing protein [Deinococcus sp. QL22]
MTDWRMHPVRVETVDLLALTHTLEHGQGSAPVTYPLLWAERTASGLHLGRAFVNHQRIQFMERHILPELGLLVNRFTGTDWIAHMSYYVDVAAILPGETQWVTRDLYLDLSVDTGGTGAVLDTDEYLAAVQKGLLSPQEAAQALTALHRLVNGVLACGGVDAWLDHEGTALTWRGAPSATAPAPQR